MADLFRLDGKVAVVVGGGGGIGKALALGLARQGADVALASRNLEKLEGGGQGAAGRPRGQDHGEGLPDGQHRRGERRRTRSKEIVAAMGTVDILVNSQGQNIKEPFENQTVANWNTLFDNNVKGVMLCCREFGKVMLEKKKGKIINIGSVAGDRGVPLAGNVGYCSSKAAVSNLTRMLAYEWAKHGINVNAIGPSVIFTPGHEGRPAARGPGRRDRAASPGPGGRARGAHGHRASTWPRRPPTT